MCVRVFFLVLSTICLLSLGYSLVYGAAHAPAPNSIPLRVPVQRPHSIGPAANAPGAVSYTPAVNDPRSVAPGYGVAGAAHAPSEAGQSREIFKPLWAVYSVLTIPFKLVSLAVWGKAHAGPASGSQPNYLPMRPPIPNPPVANRYHGSPYHQPVYNYPPPR